MGPKHSLHALEEHCLNFIIVIVIVNSLFRSLILTIVVL